jgi:TolB protein
VLGALSGCGIALAFLALPSEATFPGKNGKIVFAGPTGNFRAGLILVDPSGAHRKVLTHGPKFVLNDSSPAFSPHGRRIAYTHAGVPREHIDMIGANGKGKRRLTKRHDSSDPAFSPSGRRIAFASFRNRTSFIFVMHRDGSHVRKLVRGMDPAFSPRGRLIAFEKDRGGSIVVMRRSGSHRCIIRSGSFPSFAPSGRRVLFRHTDSNLVDQLFQERTNCTHRRQLTSNTNPNLKIADPAFSPDGTQIVFAGEDNTGGGESDDIYVINADGTGQHQITSDGGSKYPDWGPARR